MPVRVKSNRFPKIIKALRPESEKAVAKTTRKITALAVAKVPVDKLILAQNTKAVVDGLHGEVRSGVRYGHGFYAGFVEFGAAQPGGRAQPYMIPAAHAGEQVFVVDLTAAIRRACKA